MLTKDSLTSITNDVNGNPRYVFHFLNVANDYDEACYIAKKLIGGRKYHTKSYGGGIVFQSYNVERDIKKINDYLANPIASSDEL